MSFVRQQLKLVQAELAHPPLVPTANIQLGQKIVDCAVEFHAFKNSLFHNHYSSDPFAQQPARLKPLLSELMDRGWLKAGKNERLVAVPGPGTNYLKGAWLEEYVYLAALKAGCDEAYFGQGIMWRSHDVELAKNEIDVIVCRGERVLLLSCKTMAPLKCPGRDAELADHAQEVAYWVAHFFPDSSYGTLVTTADMVDERRNRPRYPAAEHRAERQGIDIIGLEELQFDALVDYLGQDQHWVPAQA